jgi:hypothetical protein
MPDPDQNLRSRNTLIGRQLTALVDMEDIGKMMKKKKPVEDKGPPKVSLILKEEYLPKNRSCLADSRLFKIII